MGTVEAALEIGAEARGTQSAEGADARPERESDGAFQRVVALKRLLPDAARDARRVEMFLREAKLAALLDHPNVVRAYDYGELDGELFLAMEYVEGQALSRVLRVLVERGGELGPSLTAHVLAEVCDGLHAAHELRDESGQALHLVHRDVSPQNVMLAYDGHVRLLDFGVAKIEAESVTKTGEVKGKTAYMSPEQAMGDAIDRRSDLFGVGALLFECLTLRRMWGDGTDMEVIRKLALEKPPRLEDAVPSSAPELCALYMRLVARDAKDRPATAKEVATELRTFVKEGPGETAHAVRQLLEKHFGEQAEEQRRLLTTSLDEVAPGQAKELRESMSPDAMPSPASRRSRSSAPNPPPSSTRASADTTGANRAATGGGRSAGVAASSRDGRPWTWLGLAAIALAGLVMWRIAAPSPPSDASPTKSASVDLPVEPARAPTSTTAPTSPSASGSASPSASPSTTASVLATSTSTSNGKTNVPTSSPSRAIAQPIIARSAGSVTTGPSTTPVVSSSPPVTVKPPPVDSEPF
jgi:serine/threonine-protein kinase